MARNRLPDRRIPVLLSSHADELVRADARAIADYLDRHPETMVAQVGRQLMGTRRVRRHRAVLRAADRAELVDGLRALAAGREHPLVACSATASAPRQAFVVPGQGAHWPGMGADAYRALPGYRATADTCAGAFEAAGATSPLGYLTAGDQSPTFSEIEIQGAQFIHAVALAEVWRSCGVVPDLTIGQSLGEIAAAVIAGGITLPDAVAVVAARASVVHRLPGRYAMATLGIGAGRAEELIAAALGWVELSVVYSAETVAISGDRDAVLAIADEVRGRGGFAREITASFPGHTSLLERFGEDFRARLPESRFADTPIQFIGGTTGDVVAPDAHFGDYWYANLRHRVRLDRAFESAMRCGAGSFVELSAHPALLFAIGQSFEVTGTDGPAVLVGSTRRDEPVLDALSANIVTAAVADPAYPWADHLAAEPDGVVLQWFPNAPMRRIAMWAHREPLASVPVAAPGVTVAVEHWEPVAPASQDGPPVPLTVVDLGGDGALAGPLRAAIESHPVATLCGPREAEVVVAIAPAGNGGDAAGAARDVPGLIGAGALDYANDLGPRCHTVCLLTVGAERVSDRDAPPSAVHAALAALHRSLGLDRPETAFTHLDLPSGELPPGAGAAVVDALLSGRDESALRASAGRYAVFERSLRDAPLAAPWPRDSGLLDDVVITGGAGAIGMHYARYLAEHGARRIVLLSRRPADPHVLKALSADHGTRVVSPPCDITDAAQLSRTAAEYGGAGATLIVHAAGSATFGTAGLTPAAVADTFAAKVTGLAQLAELWPARPHARMLLCSSISGVWGGRGHAAYSAANRLLDAMAGELRARGRHCVAVRWGLWRAEADGAWNRGIVDVAEAANIERSGLRPMTPRDAIEASLREWRDDPLVYAADAARLRTFLDSRRSEPAETAATDAVAEAAVPVVDAVRGQLAAVLGIDPAGEVNLGESLFDLGIDSMLAVDLRKRLKRAVGRTVPLATLMGEITGDELVAQLSDAEQRLTTVQKVDISRD